MSPNLRGTHHLRPKCIALRIRHINSTAIALTSPVEALSIPSRGTQSHSIAAIVQNFKATSTRKINPLQNAPGQIIWQHNYYERIIRNDNVRQLIQTYIRNNPTSWELDQLHPDHPAHRAAVYTQVRLSVIAEIFSPPTPQSWDLSTVEHKTPSEIAQGFSVSVGLRLQSGLRYKNLSCAPVSPQPLMRKQPVIRSHSRNCATVSLFVFNQGAAPPTILRGH